MAESLVDANSLSTVRYLRRGRAAMFILAVFTLASCSSASSPEAYTGLLIQPRELNVAVGVSGPVTINYVALSRNGQSVPVPRAAVVSTVRDTFYAAIRNDSIFGRRLGQTYLRAEYRADGRTLRDSVPITVFEVR